MMTRRWGDILCGIVIAVLAMMPVLFLADEHSVDQEFVRTLDVAGIDYPNFSTAVALGHGICGLFDSGASLDRVLLGEWVVGAVSTLDESRFLVESAAMAYCPQYALPPGPLGVLVPFGTLA